MGLLVDGIWQDRWYDTKTTNGRFIRSESQFRNAVEADAGADFPAESGRYHLYVSHACPWAHRTVIFRKLKRLEDVISLSVVDHFMGNQGWHFSENPGAIPDSVNGARYLHQIYTKAQSDYSGRVTVPVLWDKKLGTIVSNESSEIIRYFNSAFDAFGDAAVDFYPADLAADIDAVNAEVYDRVNNGVYKCGFATTQEAYDEAVTALFSCLDRLEGRLAQQRYLVGDRLTEADWRLFTTLVRFDAVYVGHFKCNLRRIADYPNLGNYLKDLYQVPGVAETVVMDHIKRHYYQSHTSVNPTGVVPLGPDQDLMDPHDRDRFASLG